MNKSLQPLVTIDSKQQRYKSFFQILLIVINLAMSPFYFGYTIAYFSSIDIDIIIDIYGITWSKTLAQGLYQGCVPIGAGIGAIASDLLLKKLSRRKCILSVNVLAFTVGLLIYIQNPGVLLVMRLLQGFCVGLYSAITPLIIKELTPTQISGTMGALNQFFVAFGVFFSFFFEYVLSKIADDSTGKAIWIEVFGFPLITILVQSLVLIFVFPYQTPKYLILQNQQQEARKLVAVIYKQSYIDQVIEQKFKDIGSKASFSQSPENNLKGESMLSQIGSTAPVQSKVAIMMALHLALLQQFVGINAVVPYGGQIAGSAIPSLKQIFPIIINLQQVIAAFVTSYLLSRIGRKVILQYGTAVGAASNAIIAIGFFIKDSNNDLGSGFILLGLVIFMANFGLSLGPVVWLYIPEIVQPSIVPYSTLVNWGGASLVMLLFPIIKEALPNENPAMLFVFFAAWCTLSIIVNGKFVLETKGKTQKQIKQQYSKLSF